MAIQKKIVFSVDSSKAVAATKKLNQLFKDTAKAKDLVDAIFKTDTRKFVGAIQQSLEKVKRLEQQMMKTPKAAAALTNSWKEATQQLTEARKQHKDYLSQQKDSARIIKESWLEPLSQLDEQVEEIKRKTSTLQEDFGKIGLAINAEDFEDAEQVMKRIMDKVVQTGARTKNEIDEIIKKEMDASKKAANNQEKLIKKQGKLLAGLNIDAADEYGDALSQVIPSFGRDLKNSLGQFDRLRRATSAKVGVAGEKIAGKGASMAAEGKMFGKSLQMLGNVLGKLGPLVGILGGLAAFVKILIDADAQAKELNKSLLEAGVAGRDLYQLGASAGGAEKAFNSLRSEYTENIRANLEWMKTAEDQIRLVGELSQSGLNLKKFTEDQNKSVRDMTDQLMTYSTLFGVSTSEIAELNAKFSLEFLQSQDKIRDGLAGISQAAKTSGMSMNRFFASVQSITSQLGLMNFNLGGTAELLNKVTKGSAYGAQVAADAIENLGKQFEEGSAVNVLGILDTDQGRAQVQKILERGLEIDREALRKLEETDPAQLSDEQKKEMAKLQRAVLLGSKAVQGDIVEKINFLESSFSSQAVNTKLRLAAGLQSIAEAQGKTLDQLTGADIKNGKSLSLIGRDIAKIPGISLEGVDLIMSSIQKSTDDNVAAIEIANREVDKYLSKQSSGAETAKQAAEDLQQAKEISRNTAAVTAAIEMGVTYFLEKIYDAVRRIMSFLADTPEQKALVAMEDHLAELRDSARVAQQDFEETKRLFTEGKATEEDVKAKKDALDLAKKNIVTGREDSNRLQKTLEELKNSGKEVSEKNIDAWTLAISEGKAGKEGFDLEEYSKKTRGLDIKAGGSRLENRKALMTQRIELEKRVKAGVQPISAREQIALIDEKLKEYDAQVQAERDKGGVSGQSLVKEQSMAEGQSLVENPAADAFGITKEGYLPFRVSPGDMVVQRDNLVDAMKGAPGASLAAELPGRTTGGRAGATITNNININGGDLQKVRTVVMQVLREYEDSQKV